jgi:hypothetical protein
MTRPFVVLAKKVFYFAKTDNLLIGMTFSPKNNMIWKGNFDYGNDNGKIRELPETARLCLSGQ